MKYSLVVLLSLCLCSFSFSEEIDAVMKRLDVKLTVTAQPANPKIPSTEIDLTLILETDPGKYTVQFGLPFGPDWLADDKKIAVLGADGKELPVFTAPLTFWYFKGVKGSIRSVLVQFEQEMKDKTPLNIKIKIGGTRTQIKTEQTPTRDTLFTWNIEKKDMKGIKEFIKTAEPYSFECPKILALLPADWLCDSMVAWEQIPASKNTAAPWYDVFQKDKYENSVLNISADAKNYEAHLFDRPATYAKIYVRNGEEKYLLNALKANNFYLNHINDGFFDYKKGDYKYVYSEGSAIMFMLTGDEKFAEVTKTAAKTWQKYKQWNYQEGNFWTERHQSFGMLAYLHAFELTGDKKLLDLAKDYFEVCLELQSTNTVDGKPSDGSWAHSAKDHGDGEGYMSSPWMSAGLMDAIWKYYRLTDDKRALKSMAMYAKFISTYALTKSGKGSYYTVSSPERGTSTGADGSAESPDHNIEMILHLSLGYYLSGGTEKKYADQINELWYPVLGMGANSPKRKFNWCFRETSPLIWFLQQTDFKLTDKYKVEVYDPEKPKKGK